MGFWENLASIGGDALSTFWDGGSDAASSMGDMAQIGTGMNLPNGLFDTWMNIEPTVVEPDGKNWWDAFLTPQGMGALVTGVGGLGQSLISSNSNDQTLGLKEKELAQQALLARESNELQKYIAELRAQTELKTAGAAAGASKAAEKARLLAQYGNSFGGLLQAALGGRGGRGGQGGVGTSGAATIGGAIKG
jgi:hypothetical protein